MPSFSSIDTNVNVQQPSLSTSRPKVDVVTPLLTGVGKLAGALVPKISAADILNQHSTEYDNELSSIEAAGTLDNATIARLNRKHKLSLQTDLAKNNVDVKDINSATTGFDNITESDKRYTVNKKGWITTSEDRDGTLKYFVNDKEQVQADMMNDAFLSLSAIERTRITQMSPEDGQAALSSIVNTLYKDKENERILSRLTVHNDITEQKLEADLPKRRSLFQNEKNLVAERIMQQQQILVASGATPTEIAASTKQMASEAWLIQNTPGAVGRTAQLGFQTKELIDFANAFVVNEVEAKALYTDIDNLDYNTLAARAKYDNTSAQIKAEMPIQLQTQAVIGDTLEKYALSSSYLGSLLGGATPTGVWYNMVISSDRTMRDVVAGGFAAYSDVTQDVDNRSKRGALLDVVDMSMRKLSTEKTVQESPLSVDDLLSAMEGLKVTVPDWGTNPDLAIIRRNYDMFIANMRKVDKKAYSVWQNDKKGITERLEAYGIELK